MAKKASGEESVKSKSKLTGGKASPANAREVLSAAKGVRVDVQRQTDVSLPALTKAPTLRAAHPVAS